MTRAEAGRLGGLARGKGGKGKKNPFAKAGEPLTVRSTKYATTQKQLLMKNAKSGNYKRVVGGSRGVASRLKRKG